MAALPLQSAGSPAGRAADLNSKIDQTRAQIERKRGTERLLTGDIASYSRRINHLQGDITSLQRREATIQADLNAKQAELVAHPDRPAQRARPPRAAAGAPRPGAHRARPSPDRALQGRQPRPRHRVLNANGFADLLERGEFMHRIGVQDHRIINVVRAAKGRDRHRASGSTARGAASR